MTPTTLWKLITQETHGGELRNGLKTRDKLDKEAAQFLKKYLHVPSEASLRLAFLNVKNGQCIINSDISSRYNAENVQVVIDLIVLLHKEKIILRMSMRLITLYADQCRLYHSKYMELEKHDGGAD